VRRPKGKKKQRSSSNTKRRKNRARRLREVSASALLHALERKTKELALSLSMMQATQDSTTDAKQRQPLRAVALSGLGMDEDVQRSVDAGFDHHLTKPINFQELQAILQKISS